MTNGAIRTVAVAIKRRADGRIVAASEDDRRGAAAYFLKLAPFHEAGHALVALALGGSVDLISPDPAEAQRISDADATRTVDPSVRFKGITVTPTPDDAEGRAMVKIAGIVQDVFGIPGGIRASGPAAFAASCANSPTDIAEFLHLVPDPKRGDELVERVRDILAARQADVWMLGKVLAERGRLTGPEVMALLETGGER